MQTLFLAAARGMAGAPDSHKSRDPPTVPVFYLFQQNHLPYHRVIPGFHAVEIDSRS